MRAVQKFECDVVIWKGDDCYSAASILEVLSANLDCGAEIVLEADGADSEPALDRLCKLLVEFREQEEEDRRLGRG